MIIHVGFMKHTKFNIQCVCIKVHEFKLQTRHEVSLLKLVTFLPACQSEYFSSCVSNLAAWLLHRV